MKEGLLGFAWFMYLGPHAAHNCIRQARTVTCLYAFPDVATGTEIIDWIYRIICNIDIYVFGCPSAYNCANADEGTWALFYLRYRYHRSPFSIFLRFSKFHWYNGDRGTITFVVVGSTRTRKERRKHMGLKKIKVPGEIISLDHSLVSTNTPLLFPLYLFPTIPVMDFSISKPQLSTYILLSWLSGKAVGRCSVSSITRCS